MKEAPKHRHTWGHWRRSAIHLGEGQSAPVRFRLCACCAPRATEWQWLTISGETRRARVKVAK